MSIYFNFQIEGDRNGDKIANEQIRLKSGTIIDDQSQYQVGIDRFKIPLANIPLFRIYSNEYKLGVGFRDSYGYDNSGGNKYQGISNAIGSMFGGRCINTTTGQYGIDNDYQTGLGAVSELNRKYIDINSQSEFTKLLNKAYCQMFSTTCINQAPISTYTISSPAGANTFGSGIANDGLTSIGSVNITNVVVAPYNGWVGEMIVGVTLKIKKLTSSVLGNPCSLGELDFFLVQYNGATALKTWYFNKGIMRGVQDFNGNTGVPGDIDKQIHITFSDEADIDAQDCYDGTLYNAYASGGTGEPFIVYSSATDGAGVLGQRADNPTLGQVYTYSLQVRNNSYQKDSANGVSAFTGAATDIECVIKTMKMRCINDTLTPQNILHGAVDTLIPQFKYDTSNNKIFLSRNNIYDLYFGTQIYMNNALKRLVSFDEYKVYDIDTDVKALEYLSVGLTQDSSKFGSVYRFPLWLEKLNVGGDVQGREPLEWDEFYEAFDTTFARDMLDSIIITSGSIASQGEIVGNGQFTRKTITDFKIDPSTTKRDYLVYQASGGARYYPLVSSQPLRDIDIIIFFQDIKGILRILTIPPHQCCSLKLEFRPNNMIYNYQ